MVASRQLEILFNGGVGRQRGRGFAALGQVTGRTAIPFLRNFIVPAAKRVSADLLEFATPETAEVVSGRKNFKSAAKSLTKPTLRKKSRKKTARRSHSNSLQNKTVGPKETILQTYLINHVK